MDYLMSMIIAFGIASLLVGIFHERIGKLIDKYFTGSNEDD
mgnify:CR=1 FL=1